MYVQRADGISVLIGTAPVLGFNHETVFPAGESIFLGILPVDSSPVFNAQMALRPQHMRRAGPQISWQLSIVW
jgi:hypothetical protein